MEKTDVMRALRKLRETQDNIISVIFDLDDQQELEKALTIIGDVMDGISAEYGLPIMSEQ